MSLVSDATREINIPGLTMPKGMKDAIIGEVRARIAIEAWRWFFGHKEDVLIEKRFFFVRLVLYVKDLEGLWTALFGPSDEALTA